MTNEPKKDEVRKVLEDYHQWKWKGVPAFAKEEIESEITAYLSTLPALESTEVKQGVVKSAEEIFDKYRNLWVVSNDTITEYMLMAMREYANQFKSPPPSLVESPKDSGGKWEIIVKLFAKAVFHGDWKWETPNERVIEMLMREAGMFPFKDEDEMIRKTEVDESFYQRSLTEVPTRKSAPTSQPIVESQAGEWRNPEGIKETYDRLGIDTSTQAPDYSELIEDLSNVLTCGASMSTKQQIIHSAITALSGKVAREGEECKHEKTYVGIDDMIRCRNCNKTLDHA